MTDPNLEPKAGETPEGGEAAPTHIEVAPPAADDAPPPAPPQQAGPRTMPQHYSLLFACFTVFIGAISVWEREHVFGAEVEGPAMISGAFLMALAGYATIIGIINILQGRLRGVMATMALCFFALYFSIPALNSTYQNEAFVTFGEISEYKETQDAPNPIIPDRFNENADLTFPAETLDAMPMTWQTPYKYGIGQFAPGPLMTLFGGILIAWVFLKGIFGGKKKEPAPAPSSSRSGRRRR